MSQIIPGDFLKNCAIFGVQTGGGGSPLTYLGTWNATTNTPTLVSSVGIPQTFYIVSVAGNTDLNGITTWAIGDWAVFNGSIWERIPVDAITASDIQNMTFTGADDSGTANAYVVTLDPVPGTEKDLSIQIFVAHSNTGASTLTVNGNPTVPITNADGSDLAPNSFLANSWAWVIRNESTATYQWMGSAGGGGVSGDTAYQKYLFASNDLGVDTAGNGKILKPYASIDYTMLQAPAIPTNGDSNTIVVMASADPAAYSCATDLAVKPNINMATWGNVQILLSNASGNPLALDSSFNNAHSFQIYDGINFGTQNGSSPITFDAHLLAPGSFQQYTFSNGSITSNQTNIIIGTGGADTSCAANFINEIIYNNLTLDSLPGQELNSGTFPGNLIQDSRLVGCSLTFANNYLTGGTQCIGNITNTQIDSSSVINISDGCTVHIGCCPNNAGTINVGNGTATLYIDDVSCPIGSGVINVTGSGTVIYTSKLNPSKEKHIANNGSDVFGNGTFAHPYATIPYAETAITTATVNNPFTLILHANAYNSGNISSKPNIHYQGDGIFTNSINDTQTLDATWNNGSGDTKQYNGINLINTIDFDFSSMTLNASPVFLFINSQTAIDTFVGNAAFPVVVNYNNTSQTDVTNVDSGNLSFTAGSTFNSVNLITTINNSVLGINNAYQLSGTITLTASGTQTISGQILGSSIQGNLVLDAGTGGGSCVIYYDKVSYPQGGVTLLNGAQFIELGITVPVPVAGPTKTFSAADANTMQVCTGAVDFTISSGIFPVGELIGVLRQAAGAVNFIAGGGVTINSPNGLSIPNQGDTVTIYQSSTDVWDLSGVGTPNIEFQADLSAPLNNVTGDGTVAPMICDNVITNLGGNYNSTTGIFTATQAGMHFFTGTATLSGETVADTATAIYFLQTGSLSKAYQWVTTNQSASLVSGGGAFNGSAMMLLQPGDTIIVNVQVSGSTPTVNIDGNPDGRTFFSGKFLG